MNPTLKTVVKHTSDARLAWNALNGVFVVYKPASLHFLQVRHTILNQLCKDLNSMHVREPRKHVAIEGNTNEPLSVLVHPSYADDPLVVGPRYQLQDMKFLGANYLDPDMSGALVCGINAGSKIINKIKESKPTSFYRVKGLLGQATDNFFKTGRIVEKSTYKHVKRSVIDKLCTSMQASHQRNMFELSGVDIQSQAAFELACKGPIRPANPNVPMLYTIKCVHFEPPEFTLEIVCINEYGMYLKTLIHDLGIQLHSNATCTQIQCFQSGLFNTNLALLTKHWNLECILNNIHECQKIIDNNQFLLEQNNATLVQGNDS